MSRKEQSEDGAMHTDISEDVIAEALRSVEKHRRRQAEAAREPSEPEETQEIILDPDELRAFALDGSRGPARGGGSVERTSLSGSGSEDEDTVPLEGGSGGHREEGASVPRSKVSPQVSKEADRQLIEGMKARIAELSRERQALENALRDKTAEAQKSYERLVWAAADLDNVKKRSTREKSDTERFTTERLLREFLPVLDNLERALLHALETSELGVLREGVQMTLTQFLSCLRRQGVHRIDVTSGEPFDPAWHEAMWHEESAAVPLNHVVREIQAGYRIQDRLLRPALVTVARAVVSVPASEVGSTVVILEEETDGIAPVVPEPTVEPGGPEGGPELEAAPGDAAGDKRKAEEQDLEAALPPSEGKADAAAEGQLEPGEAPEGPAAEMPEPVEEVSSKAEGTEEADSVVPPAEGASGGEV